MSKSITHYAILTLQKISKYMIMLAFFASVGVYFERSRVSTSLEKVRESGELRVLSRNGPTTYYEGPHGMTGFEYHLSKAFADHLGVRLVIEEEEDLAKMFSSLGKLKGKTGDLAAAGLTVTQRRQQSVTFSTPYLQVTQQLIYRAGEARPKTIEDLYGKTIVVIANSSHVENLKKLQRQYPKLEWEERHDVEMIDLLEMVHEGEIEHTLVDSNAYDMNGSLYPSARVAFDVSETESIAWAFPKSKDDSLLKEAQAFFKQMNDKDFISDLKERFYGHTGEMDIAGALTFSQRLNSRLPKWRDEIANAARKNNLDWQLLAAISYQESHWNPKAVSPTGVRGFMMLTRSTAKEVGITNRTNAKQSIHGGAKYFKGIYNRLPDRLTEPDRTFFALAAYNIGMGHLEDARILTEHFGGNPDKWVDVRDNLEKLSKRKYYKSTKHGYARGWEAVSYVQNIRNFYNIIEWREKEALQQLALVEEPRYDSVNPAITKALQTLNFTTQL